MLNLFANSSLGASSLFIPILANTLTGSHILVGIIGAGYGITSLILCILVGLQISVVHRSRLGFLASSFAFFAHALAYDDFTLMLVRLAAGVATSIYTGAMFALSHDKCNNGKLAGVVSLAHLDGLWGR